MSKLILDNYVCPKCGARGDIIARADTVESHWHSVAPTACTGIELDYMSGDTDANYDYVCGWCGEDIVEPKDRKCVYCECTHEAGERIASLSCLEYLLQTLPEDPDAPDINWREMPEVLISVRMPPLDSALETLRAMEVGWVHSDEGVEAVNIPTKEGYHCYARKLRVLRCSDQENTEYSLRGILREVVRVFGGCNGEVTVELRQTEPSPAYVRPHYTMTWHCIMQATLNGKSDDDKTDQV